MNTMNSVINSSQGGSDQFAMETTGLNVYYGDFRAVKDINLPIQRQRITAIIGPSGCGKSTVLRAFNRMNELVPSARATGQVLLHGKNIYDADVDPVQVRKRVGMVFQKPNPFPKSIYENIAWGAKINGFNGGKGELDDLVESALKGAALWDEVHDKLGQSGLSLSGGPGDGVTVNPGTDGKVFLRGISMNGQGGNRGIVVQSGAEIHIERCSIANMGDAGLRIEGGTVVSVSRAVISSNLLGIDVPATAAPLAMVSDSRLTRNVLRGIRVRGGVFGLDRVVL